jgi:hypothetical protein
VAHEKCVKTEQEALAAIAEKEREIIRVMEGRGR